MFKPNHKSVVAAWSAITLSWILPALAQAQAMGTDIGNGGDGCVAEFKATANRLGITIATHSLIRPKLTQAQYQEFFQKLKYMRVVQSASQFLIDPKTREQVEAINDGSSRVELSQTWCNKPRGKQKDALVLHEVFGLMGIEKSQDYSISSLLWQWNMDVSQEMVCSDRSQEIQLVLSGADSDGQRELSIRQKSNSTQQLDKVSCDDQPNGEMLCQWGWGKTQSLRIRMSQVKPVGNLPGIPPLAYQFSAQWKPGMWKDPKVLECQQQSLELFNKKVTVIGSPEEIRSYVQTGLTQAKLVTLVSRSTIDLPEVLKEQAFEQSGLVLSEQEQRRLGVSEVDYLLIVYRDPTLRTVSARLLTREAFILGSWEAKPGLSTQNAAREILSKILADLTGKPSAARDTESKTSPVVNSDLNMEASLALDPSQVGEAARFIPVTYGNREIEVQATELTQLQYFLIRQNLPAQFRQAAHCDAGQAMLLHGLSLCAHHPVENISLEDAQAVATALNQIQTDYTYQLPTEAEWEFFSHAGSPKSFPYSFGFNDAGTLQNYAWYDENADSRTHAIAQKKPNSWGIYDVHGNVAEWVLAANPAERVARGGSYLSAAVDVKTVSRSALGARGNPSAVGMRLIRVRRARPVEKPAQQPVNQPGSNPSGSDRIGMTFAVIRPGTFMMGSPESESGRYGDEVQHRVTLTSGFEIQTTSVTQAQWVQVMGSNPSYFKEQKYCTGSYVATPVAMCPNHPVEQVSFEDVQSFLEKMNSSVRDGYKYRLPTEAEWEYAARAGTQTAYYFGDAPIDQYAWYDGSSGIQTHEVAKLKPNAYGLYDMSGNVWQWVQDWYGDYSRQDQTNPPGAQSGSSRVLRGGSWYSSARFVRSANRLYDSPGNRADYVGFRLARDRRAPEDKPTTQNALGWQGNTYTTTTGAKFTMLADGWIVAPDGTQWSQSQGWMKNKGSIEMDDRRFWETGRLGVVVDSAATRACKKIGATLPTMKQYDSLRQFFEQTEPGMNAKFTQQGLKDLFAVFPDINDKGTMVLQWASSVLVNSDVETAGVFDDHVHGDYVDRDHSVRCVRR